MAELAVGFMHEKMTFPVRGERVAAATEKFLKARGLSLPELAFQARIDKRDLQNLLRRRHCGGRLQDALEAFFGWAFTDEVALAVHGADRLTAREAELARYEAAAAAAYALLQRERAAFAAPAPVVGGPPGRARLRAVAPADRDRAGHAEAPSPA